MSDDRRLMNEDKQVKNAMGHLHCSTINVREIMDENRQQK